MGYKVGLVECGAKELPMHRHGTYEMIVYLQGRGQMHTSAGSYPVQAGSLIIVPPGVSHQTVGERGMQRIYINGNFDGILKFDSPVVRMDNAENEGVSLARMIYRNRYESEEYVSALCNAFTHFLLQNLHMEDEISLAVRRIVCEITSRFHEPRLDLRELLGRSGYAEDYIRAHFKRYTGKSPTAFLAGFRIRHACYLMDVYQNTLSLAEISTQCGYTDYVLFSKRFKAIMGISPREYKAGEGAGASVP